MHSRPTMRKPTGKDLRAQIDQLRPMPVLELRRWHLETFGEEAKSYHPRFLFRLIARRLQSAVTSPLSEEARQFALALARDSAVERRMSENLRRRRAGLPIDLTVTTTLRNPHAHRDSRLPLPGSLVARPYKGQTIVVKVLDSGFEYDGRVFTSLSSIAQEVTGAKWNGFAFFGLAKEKHGGKQ